MTRSRSLAWAILAFSVTQGACTTWRYETATVPEVVNSSPQRVWVPVGVDSFVILMAPRIINDSLYGLIEGSAEGGQALHRFAAPLSEVPRVATERPNTAYGFRVVLALTGMLLTLALGTVILGSVQ